MFEDYNPSSILDERGFFREDYKNSSPVTDIPKATDLMDQRITEIRDVLGKYYKKSNKNMDDISSKINGNQKQLLSDTIDKLGKQDPEIKKMKSFLMDTAALESSYRLNAQAKGSSASGWFQFIDSTRNSILKQLNINMTKSQFNNNPEVQVLAAAKLYKDIIKQAKKNGVLYAAARQGFSEKEVVHAYWLNPTWARNYFLKGERGGSDSNGTTVAKYLAAIKGYNK